MSLGLEKIFSNGSVVIFLTSEALSDTATKVFVSFALYIILSLRPVLSIVRTDSDNNKLFRLQNTYLNKNWPTTRRARTWPRNYQLILITVLTV